MTTRTPTLLLDGATRQPVPAVLVEEVTEEEIRATDSAWLPYLQETLREAIAQGVPRDALPEHAHWNWTRKFQHRNPETHFLGMECDGVMQGLIALRTDKTCRIPEQAGLPLVYVDYLSTAPWNLPNVQPHPRYRSVGSGLIVAAARFSQRIGLYGRLGLHSLPQAEYFYETILGMTGLGVDEEYEGLRYFETTPVQSNTIVMRSIV